MGQAFKPREGETHNESAAKFFVEGVEDARFTFSKNERGDVVSLTRWQFVEQVAQRVP